MKQNIAPAKKVVADHGTRQRGQFVALAGYPPVHSADTRAG
jgi:hypothetical protein